MSDEDTQELDLLNNGMVQLRIGDEVIHLRRPKLGEFRKMREGLYDLQANITSMAKAVGELNTDEERSAYRLADRMEDATLAWWSDAVSLIGDAPLPAADDLPVWMASMESVIEVVTHWRTRPVSPGVR